MHFCRTTDIHVGKGGLQLRQPVGFTPYVCSLPRDGERPGQGKRCSGKLLQAPEVFPLQRKTHLDALLRQHILDSTSERQTGQIFTANLCLELLHRYRASWVCHRERDSERSQLGHVAHIDQLRYGGNGGTLSRDGHRQSPGMQNVLESAVHRDCRLPHSDPHRQRPGLTWGGESRQRSYSALNLEGPLVICTLQSHCNSILRPGAGRAQVLQGQCMGLTRPTIGVGKASVVDLYLVNVKAGNVVPC